MAREAADDARPRARELPGDDRGARPRRRDQGLPGGEGGSLMEHYDLIVLGSGSAARDAAAKAVSKYGAKVALAETTRWGGSCPNVACKPTKAYLVVAELVHDINELAGKLGIEVGPGHDRPGAGQGSEGLAQEAAAEMGRGSEHGRLRDLRGRGHARRCAHGQGRRAGADSRAHPDRDRVTHRRPTDRRDRGDRLGRPRLRARV